MSNTPSTLFTSLLSNQFSVFPLQYGGKTPIGSWKQYQLQRASAEQCEKWDAGRYNVAIATGAVSNIFVLDIDGAEGTGTLFELELQHGFLPETVTAKTGKGMHYYFRYPKHCKIGCFAGKDAHGNILSGIDIRGDGGYVVAPPSLHPNGEHYEWERSPDDYEILDAPDWLLDIFTPPNNPEPQDTVVSIERHPFYPDAYIEKAFQNQCDDLKRAENGGRNDALCASAFSLGQLVPYGLSEQRITASLTEIALEIGLNAAETSKTIKSGLTAGIKESPSPDVLEFASLDGDAWLEVTPLTYEAQANGNYPIDAFPSEVKSAITEYQQYGQQPLSLVATSALANMSVAVQGLVDVARDDHLISPVSLNIITVAKSGERKTGADKAFGQCIRDWEKQQIMERANDIQCQEAEISFQKIFLKETKKKLETAIKDGNQSKIEQLGQEIRDLEQKMPTPMKSFSMMHEDINPQTLQVKLDESHPSGGLFTDEGAIAIGGHGFNPEHALAYFGIFNKLWDGGTIKRERLTTQSTYLTGKRLTVSIMMQPSVLHELFTMSGGQAIGTGFMARFLLIQPESTIGTRRYQEGSHQVAMMAYERKLKTALQTPLPYEHEEMLILKPKVLKLSDSAKQSWIQYHDRIESQSGLGGEYHMISDVAAKSADNAARIAAILHVFEHGTDGDISKEHMESGIALAQWYLDEAKRIIGSTHEQYEMELANNLLTWIIRWCKNNGVCSVNTTAIAQNVNPKRLREKRYWEPALATLVEYGYLQQSSDYAYTLNPSVKGWVV